MKPNCTGNKPKLLPISCAKILQREGKQAMQPKLEEDGWLGSYVPKKQNWSKEGRLWLKFSYMLRLHWAAF